jgi:cell division protein FtsW
MAINIARRAATKVGAGFSLGHDSSPQWINQRVADIPRALASRAARTIPSPRAADLAPSVSLPTYGRAPVAAAQARTQRLNPFDSSLLLIAALLVVGGLVMTYSASQITSQVTTGDPNALFFRQLAFVGVGCLVALGAARLPLDLVRRHVWRLMGISLLLLALVPLVGHAAFGAQRWLKFGDATFQPSELAKLALVLFFADWLTLKGGALGSFRKGLFPFAVITAVVLVFIWAENDLGTILVIFIMATAMFYAAGAKLAHLLLIAAIGTAGAFAVTMITPFRRARVEAFLHPLSPGCANDNAYHVCHAVVSLMSGGLFGRGLGDGLAKANYLPNPATDSIFAVVGEELGLAGCLAVLGCFLALAFIGFRIGRHAQCAFDALLACGITTWLVVQAALNIGSVVSIIPFTGVPLPFFSIGGSSLVVSLAAIGLLLNVSRRTRPREAAI